MSYYSNIPHDPIILLSYINTQLRDYHADLEELCSALMVDKQHIIDKLKQINYEYNPEQNQFL